MTHLKPMLSAEAIASGSGDVLLHIDAEQFIQAAGGDHSLLSGPPNRLVGLSVAFAFSDVISREISDHIASIRAGGGKPGPIKARVRRFDGSDVSVELFVVAEKGVSETVLVVRRTDGRTRDLSSENQLLQAIVENLPTNVFVKEAQNLTFTYINRANETFLGVERKKVLGSTDNDWFPKDQAEFFRAKDREALRDKQLVTIEEEPIECADMGLRWLRTKKVPILGENGEPAYLLGIAEDITAKKVAEERANRLSRELASIIEAAPAAVITWTRDGIVQSWNPGAERLYGLAEKQAVGQSINKFVPEGELEEFAGRQERLQNGERTQTRVVYRKRSNFEIEVAETLFLIPGDHGNVSRTGCIARDHREIVRLRRAAEITSGVGSHETGSEPERSGAMQEVIATAERVAENASATVLLLGETGVGKGWLARRIHGTSPRSKRPFFEVNCAGLGPQLMESELFGHEMGAFTGATSQKRGLVEAADGGTLFLDEVGELPIDVQAQLLTFLDDKSFRRVGGTRVLSADVRILAATNRDLKEAMSAGRFRRDLYYRISVFPLRIPPLREHREDIEKLCSLILTEFQRTQGRKEPFVLTAEALKVLEACPWPGNVRELRNALERACILDRDGVLGVEQLASDLLPGAGGGGRFADDDTQATLEEVEQRHIDRVLQSVGGNRTRAAELLGISRSTLKRKLAPHRGGSGPPRAETNA